MLLIAIALAVLMAAGAAGFFVVTRRKDTQEEAELEPVMDEQEALKRISEMAKEAADTLEESKNGNGDEEGGALWVETDVKDGIEVESASVTDTTLNIQATVTKEASADVQALWADIETNGGSDGDELEEDKETLHLENLKRSYHNAIGRLPYGIPAPELREREWTDLAAALAIGPKKTGDGGKEVTEIEGRWYYSDHEDSGTFLKEHGAKPKEAPKALEMTDGDALLAKLEERFILGEISEETYRELKEKYGSR
jgi:hypothetical protein